MALFAGAHFALLVGIAVMMRASSIRDALSVDDVLQRGVKPMSVVRVYNKITAHPVCAHCRDVHTGIATAARTFPSQTEGVVLEVAEPSGDAVVEFEGLLYSVRRDEFDELETVLTESSEEHPGDTREDAQRRHRLLLAKQSEALRAAKLLLLDNLALSAKAMRLETEVEAKEKEKRALQQERERLLAELQVPKSKGGSYESPF
jgi:hypothetical protein